MGAVVVGCQGGAVGDDVVFDEGSGSGAGRWEAGVVVGEVEGGDVDAEAAVGAGGGDAVNGVIEEGEAVGFRVGAAVDAFCQDGVVDVMEEVAVDGPFRDA